MTLVAKADLGEMQQLTFEERLARLEAIVERLEEGNMGLAESLELFEEAVAIERSCRTELSEAELRISKLTGDVESDKQDHGEAADE